MPAVYGGPWNAAELPTPEQLARQQIDAMLVAAGWAVQDYAAYNPSTATGIALREGPLKSSRSSI